MKSVVTEAESGNLSYTQAFRLLGGIKGSAYNEIKGAIYDSVSALKLQTEWYAFC